MDIIVVLRNLLLLLNACIVPTNGQKCVSLDQIGESVGGKPSVLQCDIRDDVFPSRLVWNSPDNTQVAVMRWTGGPVRSEIDNPDIFSCDWIPDGLKSVLTIKNTSLDHDGMWRCTIENARCDDASNLDRHFLNVKALPLEQFVHVSGLDNGWVDRELEYMFNCTVDAIKPEGSVYWRIGKDTLLLAQPNSKKNPDGKTFRMEGVLYSSFSGKTSPVQVDCLVTEMDTPDDILLTKSYKFVEIWWKATTEVSSVTTDDPIKGQPYSLQCDVTDGNPGEGNSYQWERDGIIEVGQTGPQLDILELDIDEHSKTFTCAADNGAGMGDHGTGLALQVRYSLTVETTVPDTAVEGSDVTLGCSKTDLDEADTEILNVQWKKDGADITRDYTSGGDRAIPSITIWDIRRSDEGDYVCVVTNSAGESQSISEKMEILYAPNRQQEDYIIRGIGLGKTIDLPCAVYANPAPTSYLWSRNGIELHLQEHEYLHITDFTEVDFGNYTCTVTNAISSVTLMVGLVPYSVPDQPSQFESMPDTSQSIFLSWLPENNGGLTQTFELDCRISTGVDEYVRIMKGIPDPNVGSGDRIPVSLVVDNLDNQQLEPTTSYDFRVRGENSHPNRTGPFAFTSGSTKVRPVVDICLHSFVYFHETTRVVFARKVVVGDISTLELQYRLIPTEKQELTGWGMMLADVDPDDGSYTRITNVMLSPNKSYEFQLVAFEGSYETLPPAETPKASVHPLPHGKTRTTFLFGTLFCGIVLGSLITLGLMFMIQNITEHKDETNTHFVNEGYMNDGASTGGPPAADAPDAAAVTGELHNYYL